MLDKVEAVIDKHKRQLAKLDELAKARFVEMFGSASRNNAAFRLVPIGELGKSVFAGGDKPKDTVSERDEKRKYPVYANGITNEGLQGYSSSCRVTEKSLTVSARGTIGFLCIREPNFTPIVRLITMIPQDWVDIVFLKYALDEVRIVSSGAVQSQLTVPEFKRIKIPLPPLPLQRQFAEFVTHIERMKGKVQASLEATQKLLGSLMQEYFS